MRRGSSFLEEAVSKRYTHIPSDQHVLNYDLKLTLRAVFEVDKAPFYIGARPAR